MFGMKFCEMCTKNKAALKRPKTAEMICKECFFQAFEDEVHQTIATNNLFSRGERVAIAASGGKGLFGERIIYIISERITKIRRSWLI